VDEVLGALEDAGTTPFYGGFDVRVHPGKVAVIDANAFPGGFNNLGEVSHAKAVAGFRKALKGLPGRAVLLAEAHTRNHAYQANVEALARLLRDAGLELETSAECVGCKGEPLVVLNRDLADGVPHALEGVPLVVPPIGMGWHVRRKATHSAFLEDVAETLGEEVGFDPWLLRPEWESVGGVDFAEREGLELVAEAVDRVALRAHDAARRHGAEVPSRTFVKADPGTYGMAVMPFGSGADVLSINSRGRQRMARGKGGLDTEQVLVQEGVPSRMDVEGTAEPVVYTAGGVQVGGFLRMHRERGALENLNTPGATFQPFGPGGPAELPPYLRRVVHLAVRVAHAAMARETRDAARMLAAPVPRPHARRP
jgi:glutamate--cysteine ligase